MGRHDKKGSIPQIKNGEWTEIRIARNLAIKICKNVVTALNSLTLQQSVSHASRVTGSHDPRVGLEPNSDQYELLSLLKIHFKITPPDPFNIANLRDAYENIYRKLISLERPLFRLVSHEVANGDANAGGDTFGYVNLGEPIIYLNDTYFVSAFEKNVNGLQMRKPTSLSERSSVILHEAVHLCYGAEGKIHRELKYNKNFNLAKFNCQTGYTNINSTLQAMNDAYVWEMFASCMYAFLIKQKKVK